MTKARKLLRAKLERDMELERGMNVKSRTTQLILWLQTRS